MCVCVLWCERRERDAPGHDKRRKGSQDDQMARVGGGGGVPDLVSTHPGLTPRGGRGAGIGGPSW